MTILDNLMGDMFERIAVAAATLSRYIRQTMLSSNEIQGAAKMVLPGELGTKAVTSYVTSVAKTIQDYLLLQTISHHSHCHIVVSQLLCH